MHRAMSAISSDVGELQDHKRTCTPLSTSQAFSRPNLSENCPQNTVASMPLRL